MPPRTPTSTIAGAEPGPGPAARAALVTARTYLAAGPEGRANEGLRALLSRLFERGTAARGCPAPGTVPLSPATAAALDALLEPALVAYAAWDEGTLGGIYESLLDPATRRRAGIYYTPAPIVETILAATLDPLLAAARQAPAPLAALLAIRVLDPACGAGAFLVAAVRRLAAALAAVDPARRPAAAWMPAACACVYGVDSDPLAGDLARYSLQLAAPGVDPATLHLHTADALSALPGGWAAFDAVTGNPPYVAHRAQPAATKAGHGAQYRTARGQYDLAVLFVERGLALLRPGGLLGYILPNKFLAADYGAPLRDLLARETCLLRLEDVSGDGTFPDAAIYPVILVVRKQMPEPATVTVITGPERAAATVPQAALCGLPGRILPAEATPAALALAGQIAQQLGRLPIQAIRCGVARAGYARSAIAGAAFAALPAAAQSGYRPLIQAQDVAPYAVVPAGPPRYLPRAAMTAAQWNAFAGPAVLVPGIVRRLRAAYTLGGPARGRVYAIPAAATPYDPFALLALLNSRLLAWYYRFLFWPVHLSGGYLRVNAPYLAALPLPLPTTAGLAGLVAPARALAAAPGAPAASALQADLDLAVCALYGVDPAALAAAETALGIGDRGSGIRRSSEAGFGASSV